MKISISKNALVFCFLIVFIFSILLGCECKKSVSLAVLPFSALDSISQKDESNSTLTKGLINALAKNESMKVISYLSISNYDISKKNISEIANELDVNYLIEGSVKTTDGSLRISVQLISAKEGEHLWAESYARPINDLADIQDNITHEVTKILLSK